MINSALKTLIEAAKKGDSITVARLLEKNRPNLNIEIESEAGEDESVPLLFYLVSSGIECKIVEMFIKYGMNIAYLTEEGLGAIDIAIRHRRLDIVKLCSRYGISLDESSRRSGMTPLMLAAAFDDTEIVEYLVEEGVDISKKDKYGMSAADYARKMGHKRSLNILQRTLQKISHSKSII